MALDNDKLVDIEGELVAPFQTEKAFHFYDGKTKAWLAKSLVEWDENENVMTMPHWLAMDKGLI